LLSFRFSAHVVLSHIAPLVEGPLLFVELPDAFQLAEVLARVGQEPVLVLNDGPTYFGQRSTVVTTTGRTWSETRSGVIGAEILADLVQCRILFVCTGNTCRSPLAMALCRVLLARQLGCKIEELPERGFQVLSAGLAAIMGEAASPEAVEVVREMGGDLQEHRSQPLTIDLLAQADCLFTMTGGHLRMLQSLNQTTGPEPCMLSPAECDVSDPIGCDIEVYRQCARQILDCLEERLPQLLEL
jgi:protein-tyrosine phosphatase